MASSHNHYIVFRNHGGKIVTVMFHITYTDGDGEYLICDVDLWQPGSDTVTIEVYNVREIKSVEILDHFAPDQNTDNNIYLMDNNK